MKSITHWNRLEPQTRNIDMADSLQAAVHDPLWLLGRQWQIGEFQGEDTGSPVEASVSVTTDPITQYRLDSPTAAGKPKPYQNHDTTESDLPLEALVERQAVRPSGPESQNNVSSDQDVRLAVEAGFHFLRMLSANSLPASVEDYAGFRLSEDDHADVGDETIGTAETARDRARIDDVVERFETVVRARALDGDALYRAIVSAGDPERDDIEQFPVPVTRSLTIQEIPTYRTTLSEYVRWYETLYTQPEPAAEGQGSESAWDSDRLEYRFAVATGTDDEGTENVFTAEEYHGGSLDWHSFSRAPDESFEQPDPPAELPSSKTGQESLVPASVTFSGMPVSRWWAFEDHSVDFNQIEAMPEDLSRLLLLEFALVYSNDWYLVPWDVPVGSVARIIQLDVTDTFDQTWSVGPTTDREHQSPPVTTEAWNMYEFPVDVNVENAVQSSPGLLLPPTFVDTIETEPVESVEFVRDELANVGWAIERTVEGRIGDPIRQRQAHNVNGEADTGPVDDSVLIHPGSDADAQYRLTTDVRPYWFPLLPDDQESQLGAINLTLGGILTDDPESIPIPRSRVLGRGNLELSIPEEEIPRGGTTVDRAYSLTRWTNGSYLLWAGQRKHRGSTEGSSGLRFDIVEEGSRSE